jgi:hypothetical protein
MRVGLESAGLSSFTICEISILNFQNTDIIQVDRRYYNGRLTKKAEPLLTLPCMIFKHPLFGLQRL